MEIKIIKCKPAGKQEGWYDCVGKRYFKENEIDKIRDLFIKAYRQGFNDRASIAPEDGDFEKCAERLAKANWEAYELTKDRQL